MTFPFSKILVPIDFEAHSADAVRLASALARAGAAEVILLHVYEPAEHPLAAGQAYTGEQWHRMTSGALARLEAARQEVAAALPGFVGKRIAQGEPATAIVELARREGCDVIVMGTHGRTGLDRLVMGSVAEQVMRRAPCVVLTVKHGAPPALRQPERSHLASGGVIRLGRRSEALRAPAARGEEQRPASPEKYH